MLQISKTRTSTPKAKPDQSNLSFGKYFTDHMFVMDYNEGKGWHSARIVPYAPFNLDPSCMVFHYGQEMFEGLKAYKSAEGKTLLFRPRKNIQRMNSTNERLCIPQVDEDDIVQAIVETVKFDEDWIPEAEGTSLYIRPFIFATDPFIGVKPSSSYIFCIILSPVGAYYPEGLNPVKIYVESEYVRAVKGGIGFAKAGANYAASLASQSKAKALHYAQVLWLDGVHRKYIDEVGTMNVFFKINGKVVTPSLEGSILPGVTRASVIELLNGWGIPVEQRLVSIDEIYAAAADGTLEEAFGTGTAAVISPIGELNNDGNIIEISGGKIGALAQRLYDTLTGIQWGRLPDANSWTIEVK
ncbi:MAG: branched-chain amino acid aminotransferase [Eubacteriales bacterium]